MDEQPPKGHGLKSRVAGKLALLLGSGLAMINGTSTTDTNVVVPAPSLFPGEAHLETKQIWFQDDSPA
jgi:hypothetical protein